MAIAASCFGSAALALVCQVPQDGAWIELVPPPREQALVLRLTSDAPAAVAETRAVQLAAGRNRLRFDWSRERVDEGSIRLEVGPGAGVAGRTKVKRLGGMLYFDVDAAASGEATVTWRYLLAGIGWKVDYHAVQRAAAGADPDRMLLDLRAAAEISMGCGRDLDDATVVLDGGRLEHFTARDGERRQVELFRAAGVPVARRYVYDPARFGGAVGVELELDTAAAELGRDFLPAGVIRVFAPVDGGAPSLLGSDVLPAAPRGERVKFSVGSARDVTVERRVLFQNTENERRDRWNKVVVRDERTKVAYKVKNGTGRAFSLLVMEIPGAQFEVAACPHPTEVKRSDAFEIAVPVPAEPTLEFEVEWLRTNLF